MAENEVRRDLATWPVAVDKRLDQNAKWIGDLTKRVTKLETAPYADVVAVSKLDALAARVAALESAPRIVTAGSQDDDRVSPAPPAPLVERVAAAIVGAQEPGWPVMDQDRKLARAALLVAAEELLGPMSGMERRSVMDSELSWTESFEAVLHARLARAKEACR